MNFAGQLGMAIAVATAVSGTVTGIVVKYGSRWGIVDDPTKHKHPKVIHEKAVPRGGGIPIFAALLTVLFFLGGDKKMWGVILGAAILMITGFLDDKYEERISPYLRLLLNGLAAVAVIGAGVGITFITNPLGGTLNLVWWLSDLFALVWLVGMQNIVGWSSGVDGQMPGFVVIAAISMVILAGRFNDPAQFGVMILGAVTAGAYLGFLPWNWHPQKIIPGYGGKSLAGFLLGVLAIMSSAKVGALILVLGIPFVDAVLVVLKRLKEKRSPVWGGYEHLHHYLLSMGWGKKRIAIFYWGVSLILAVAALQLKSGQKWFTMAAALLVIGGAILWLHYFSTFLRRPGRDSG